MAKLNNTPLQIRAKRGTVAQITSTTPTPYQLEGELAYATDTKEFYVSDGTNFVLSGENTFAKLDGTNQPFTGNLDITKTSPIFKQTDTTTGNVFTQTLGTNQNFELTSGDFLFSGGNVGIGTTTPNAKLDALGPARLGDSTTNYTTFEADGSMEFVGDATVYDDQQMPLISTTKQNPSGKIIENKEEQTLDFKDSATESDYAIASIQMSHKWKLGTDISPHLHWTQTASGNPNWMVQYRWQRNGQAKTTAWTDLLMNVPIFTYVSGSLDQISNGADITPPTDYSISDIVQFRIIRDTDNDSGLFSGTDPVSGDVSSLSFDFHYEINTVGSRSEYSK
jgi:hypothetical protein